MPAGSRVSATESRLRRLAAPRRPEPGRQESGQQEPGPEGTGQQLEHCDLCREPVAPEHRHIVDLQARSLLCACRACTILFDRREAGGGHYRLVPERRLELDGFRLDDAQWAAFRIPVELAFFFRSSGVGRVAAVYPSPAGATESLLELEAWQDLERGNPVLLELEDDVEALLVNRAGGRRDHFLVPIDDCYALAGLMRTHWKGFAGGGEVWREIDLFFDRLRERAR